MSATETQPWNKRNLFRLAGLKPFGTRQTQEGRCACMPGEPTILYKKGPGLFQCDVCIALSQAYLNPPPKSSSRLVDGSYLLITTERVDFWGNQRLSEVNDSIKCHPGTGIIRGVKRELVRNPPEPPWMFISFAKAPLTGAGLHVTEDNTRLRFSGKTTLADKTEVHAVNRQQVMQMAAVGLTDREWRTYMMAYAGGTPADFKVMENLTEQYPALETLRWIPPVDSPEHNALRLVISTPKEN